jgi:hypothetical protein
MIMSEAELRRVREDLDTMRQAAGLELPFDWADVCCALALVPAGAILSAWAYFGPADYYGFGLVPLVLLALTAVAHRVWKHRRGNPIPSQRRQITMDMTITLVVAVAMAGYLIWEKTLGLPGSIGGAIACFFLGVVCAVGGFCSRAERVAFAGTMALVPFGLLIPFCTGKQMITAVGGLAVMVAGLAAGAILAWQLRRERTNDEPTSH